MKPGIFFKPCVAITIATAWGLVLSAPDYLSAAVTYRTVVMTGDAVPGTEAGVAYDLFENPILNATGQVAFSAYLTGTGVDLTNDNGIWSEGSGALALVARTGDAAPGAEPRTVFKRDANVAGFTTSSMNTSGQISFVGSLGGIAINSTNDHGIWIGTPNSIGLVARLGSSATGTGGVFSDYLGGGPINEAGIVTFKGYLADSNTDYRDNYGVWSGDANSILLVMRSYDPVVEPVSGQIHQVYFHPNNTRINANGQAAFYGILDGPSVTSLNDVSIWSGASGSLSLVARENSPAPGTEAGVVFYDLSVPRISLVGQTTFVGFLTGTGVDSTNNLGVWSHVNGSLEMAAREGDDVPGMPLGFTFNEFFNPRISSTGQTIFTATINGPGQDGSIIDGMWRHMNGVLEPIALAGDPAPGTGPGIVFESLNTLIEINEVGQSAFWAALDGEGIDNTNDFGLWASSPGSPTTLIAREGDLFDVNNDPLIESFRTIQLIYGFDLNDAGQLAIKLGFTDGTEGLFVATIGLHGDLNGDGFVGVDDLNIVLPNWNQNVTPGDPLAGDASGDGFIGVDDLNIVLANWNAGTPPTSNAIPEPGTAVSLIFVSGLALRRRLG